MADDGLRKDVGEAVNSDVVPKNGNTFTPDPEYGGGIEGDDVEVERVERVYKYSTMGS
jgi:hypothetical protein